jgi:hypothetical protein
MYLKDIKHKECASLKNFIFFPKYAWLFCLKAALMPVKVVSLTECDFKNKIHVSVQGFEARASEC